jgi:hypothetical protein
VTCPCLPVPATSDSLIYSSRRSACGGRQRFISFLLIDRDGFINERVPAPLNRYRFRKVLLRLQSAEGGRWSLLLRFTLSQQTHC